VTRGEGVRTELADDASTLTLTIVQRNGPDLARVPLAVPQVRSLLMLMAQHLARMEGGRFTPSPTSAPGDKITMPPIIPRPGWLLGQAENGDPALMVELLPGMWTAFTLSPESGKTVSELLHDMLKPGHAVN